MVLNRDRSIVHSRRTNVVNREKKKVNGKVSYAKVQANS